MAIRTVQGPSDKHCDCCGRTHRVLICVDGYWMGKTCAADYSIYRRNQNITSVYWHGWEKKHAKVARMVHAA